MSNAEDHAAAIAALNESEVNGRTVYVSESLPKEKIAGSKKTFAESKRSKFKLRRYKCEFSPVADKLIDLIYRECSYWN